MAMETYFEGWQDTHRSKTSLEQLTVSYRKPEILVRQADPIPKKEMKIVDPVKLSLPPRPKLYNASRNTNRQYQSTSQVCYNSHIDVTVQRKPEEKLEIKPIVPTEPRPLLIVSIQHEIKVAGPPEDPVPRTPKNKFQSSSFLKMKKKVIKQILKPGNNDDIAVLSQPHGRNSSTTLSRYLKTEQHTKKTSIGQHIRYGSSFVSNIVEAQRSKFLVASIEEQEQGDHKIRQALEQFKRNLHEDPGRNRYQNIAKIHQL